MTEPGIIGLRGMPNGSPPNEGLGKNRPLFDETNFRTISGKNMEPDGKNHVV